MSPSPRFVARRAERDVVAVGAQARGLHHAGGLRAGGPVGAAGQHGGTGRQVAHVHIDVLVGVAVTEVGRLAEERDASSVAADRRGERAAVGGRSGGAVGAADEDRGTADEIAHQHESPDSKATRRPSALIDGAAPPVESGAPFGPSARLATMVAPLWVSRTTISLLGEPPSAGALAEERREVPIRADHGRFAEAACVDELARCRAGARRGSCCSWRDRASRHWRCSRPRRRYGAPR